MALYVQKFGGTSVGTIERIKCVADKLTATFDAGHQVVGVVSAMNGETDRLVELAHQMMAQPDPREYSVLVSTGEQVSMSLLAMELIARGYKSRSYTGGQVKIVTSHDYKKARIMDVEEASLRSALADGYIPIIAGFQGIDSDGNITTLGRGGSDTTGVAIASALNADECQIYTDVDGVYTADPRVVPGARRLDEVTFEEMLELASLGTKVLQTRAVEFAGKFKVPLRVLSSFNEGPGTLITFDETSMERPIVSGIAYNRKEAKLTILGVPDEPHIAASIIEPISSANIDIDMIVQNVATKDESTDFTFTVARDDYEKSLALLQQTAQKLGARDVKGDTRIAKLSLVGVGMRSHSGIASTMFTVLGKEGINIQAITTSEIKVSVIMDEKYLELGMRVLHTAFGLDVEPKEEFDPV